MSTRTHTLKPNAHPGFRSVVRGPVDLPTPRTRATRAAFASSALTVAAAELGFCVPVLLILTGLRVVAAGDAAIWAVATLAPLSLSISFLTLVGARLEWGTTPRKAEPRHRAPGSPRERYV